MRTSPGDQPTGRTPRPARLLALLAAATLGVSLVATTPLASQAHEGAALAAALLTDREGRGDPAGEQVLVAGWAGADAATLNDWEVSWTHNARFAVSWNKLSTGSAAASRPAAGG